MTKSMPKARCLRNTLLMLGLLMWLVLSGSVAGPLSELHRAVLASKSDEVVVWQDGSLVYRYSSGKVKGPIQIMSCTKSVVALAIGLAVEKGALKGVDVPVSRFYPEWRKDGRRDVTIRHLLNHTSGLQANKTTEDIYRQPDFVRYGLMAKLEQAPGERFFYNNRATNVLPGIIEKACGQKMDVFLRDRLFRRIDIRDSDWQWDRDKAGNPHGMSGLAMRPRALANLGQLILQKGVWNGQQIISAGWLEAMLSPGQAFEPGCGWLWWLKSDPDQDLLSYDETLLQEYERSGVARAHLERLRTLTGRSFSRPEFKEQLLKAFGSREAANVFLKEVNGKGLPDARIQRGPTRRYVAEGYLGQFLVIIPSRRLVGVRLLHYTSECETSGFSAFPELLNRF